MSYLVPDILSKNLRIVFCGTAPSRISAAKKAYYANPGNQFWQALHQAGFTPRLLSPEEYPLLPEWGIGLTDLCKTASGNDEEIPSEAFDAKALEEKIKEFQPQWLAFTSKNAAQTFKSCKLAYGEADFKLEQSRVFVLPSTSGRARRFFTLGPWQELAMKAGYAE